MISSVPWWAWLVPLARPLFQLTLSVVMCALHRRATGSWPTVPDWASIPEMQGPVTAAAPRSSRHHGR